MNDKTQLSSSPSLSVTIREGSLPLLPPGISQLIISFQEILSQINKSLGVVLIGFEMKFSLSVLVIKASAVPAPRVPCSAVGFIQQQ